MYRIVYFYLLHLACALPAQNTILYLEHLYQQKEYTLLQHEITQLYEQKTILNHQEQGKISLWQYKIQDTTNNYFIPILQKALSIKKRHSLNSTPQNEQEKYLYHVFLAYSVRKKKQILPVCAYQDTFLNRQHTILFNLQQEHVKKHYKYPLVAGAMSAIIPGLGKVYAGKPVQMIIPLLSTALWAVQAAEIAIKSGYTHFAFWIPISIGSIFYVSNIYGSSISAKKYNQQQKKLYHAQLDTLLDTFADHYSQR